MARARGLVVVALLLVGARASAEPSPQAVKAAKQHYSDGKKFQDAANYDAAIVEYEAAHKLAPKPVLLFNIGQCYRLKGDKQKAIDAYEAFLAAAPDDPIAGDAREYVTTLRLRIEVERAEAASKRASEEAEVARKQIHEAEEARKRAEAEEATRRQRAIEEQKRIQHEAELAAAADRRRQADEAAARDKRVADAQHVGYKLRLGGGLTVVGAALLGGLAFITVADADSKQQTVQSQPNHTWSQSGEDAVNGLATDSTLIKSLWGIAIGAAIVGSGVAIAGAVMRSHAVERAQQAMIVPLAGPKMAGLGVAGRF